MQLTETYSRLLKVFSSRKRPDRFTIYEYGEKRAFSEECEEHEATLARRSIDTIAFNDVQNIDYSPILFITTDGFLYYLPGLARLASGSGEEYFLDNFLIHMNHQKRRDAFSDVEKIALADYLACVKFAISKNIQDHLDEEDLDELLEWLTSG